MGSNSDRKGLSLGPQVPGSAGGCLILFFQYKCPPGREAHDMGEGALWLHKHLVYHLRSAHVREGHRHL